MPNAIVSELTYSTATTGGGGTGGIGPYGVNPYVAPVDNTQPNSFGTVDATLDPAMSDTQLQAAIDGAGDGGIVEWPTSGGTHYTIGTNLRFLTGQKHFTDDSAIVVCTLTTGGINFDFLNMKSPKGGGASKTDITISDLEFWGHTNVPNRPPSTAPRSIIVPWRNAILRRVKVKGARSTGLRMQGDRIPDLNIMIDTCEIAYNVDSTVDNGTDGAVKFTELGVCGTPPGDVMTVIRTRSHHNWNSGFWTDIGCAGVMLVGNEFDNNTNAGIHWEVAAGPVYIRDNNIHDNGQHAGIWVVSGYRGTILNNTLDTNGGPGILLFQDNSSPTDETRSSLTCPNLPGAGQNEGYIMNTAQWTVRGNVMLGGDTVTYTDALFGKTLADIDYSTSAYPANQW